MLKACNIFQWAYETFSVPNLKNLFYKFAIYRTRIRKVNIYNRNMKNLLFLEQRYWKLKQKYEEDIQLNIEPINQ